MMKRMPDASLYLLIHQSSTSLQDYSSHHALLATAVSCLVAEQLGLDKAETDLIMRAALTMNIAMTGLQNKLALQSDPLTAAQRQTILMHPIEGVRILRACGVEDERWLGVVEDHHESKDGRGYPAGKKDFELSTASKVIHQADLFAARLSPRKGRSALAANLAARAAYLGADGQPDSIGASLVKKLGIYPPGSFVHLASGETAVVVRRGLMANTPRAAAIANSQGQPYGKPVLRETSDKSHEIRHSLAADSVKVLISHERILPFSS
jgi:HD-GYP domain-containing protein (c-di-GMP phosphodiesterase class II)